MVNISTIAAANLIVQVLLFIALLSAVFYVKKGEPGRHCTILKVTVLAQIIAVFSVMLPSILGYMRIKSPGFLIYEMLAHHTIGLLVIAFWAYINLAFGNIVRMPRNLAGFMRLAFVLWTLALILGLHIYLQIYL